MLDWEENLFLGLKALYRQAFVRPEERRRAEVRVTLKSHRSALLLLARMIARRPVGLFESADPQLCDRERVFLPPEFSNARTREGNCQWYELRTLIGSIALRDQWCRSGMPLLDRCAACQREFPFLDAKIQALDQELPAAAGFWHTVGVLPVIMATPGVVPEATISADSSASAGEEPTTELEGQGQSSVTVLAPTDEDGPGADLPMHTFEKVETLEEYTGESRKTDDDDELSEHQEALQELKMSQVIRSPERPRSIYRSDLILDGPAFETKDAGPGIGLPYPEWDHRKREYRPNWCFVNPQSVTSRDPAWVEETGRRHLGLIRRLKRQFATLVTDWLHLKRQAAGDEFDLDAVVESEVDRRGGQTPSESIYLDRRRDLHDLAVLILLDLSYSTESWLNNRRVLDVIRDTVFCVGEVLQGYLAEFAVAGFSSNTRRSCRFDLVKDFKDPWLTTRGGLGTLQPCGYTRMGPALRHAQELLVRQKAQRKSIVLITDGRPCDYDRYEGTYGIQDVRRALEAGREHGLQSHAFAVEKRAAEYFPQMFTQHHYDIIPQPERLAQVLCKRFAQWMTH